MKKQFTQKQVVLAYRVLKGRSYKKYNPIQREKDYRELYKISPTGSIERVCLLIIEEDRKYLIEKIKQNRFRAKQDAKARRIAQFVVNSDKGVKSYHVRRHLKWKLSGHNLNDERVCNCPGWLDASIYGAHCDGALYIIYSVTFYDEKTGEHVSTYNGKRKTTKGAKAAVRYYINRHAAKFNLSL